MQAKQWKKRKGKKEKKIQEEKEKIMKCNVFEKPYPYLSVATATTINIAIVWRMPRAGCISEGYTNTYHWGSSFIKIPMMDISNTVTAIKMISIIAIAAKSRWKFRLSLHLSKTTIDNALAPNPKSPITETLTPWTRNANHPTIDCQLSKSS